MFEGKEYRVHSPFAVCEAEIVEQLTIIGEWNGSATINVRVKGSETAFDCLTRYDLSSLDDFEDAFIDYVQSLLDYGWLNDYIQAGDISCNPR